MYEYIYIIIAFLVIFIFAYVKLKYPFWNVQPAFHVYDFWRYWAKQPFYIQNGILIKTKFYDGKNVETIPYSETTDAQRAQIVDLLQCHYIDSDRVLTSLDASGLNAIMTGYSQPSYVSFYNDTTYEIVPGESTNIQHYPPGTQEKYNSFQSRIPVIKDGVKPGITERQGGVWNPLLRNPKDFERILMTEDSPYERHGV